MAREIAIRIRDEIKDLLDEKGIMIPSAYREGVPREARLYGEDNSRLEEAMVGLLVEQADVTMTEQDAGDASHVACNTMGERMVITPADLAQRSATQVKTARARRQEQAK